MITIQSFCGLCMLLAIGKWLRIKVKPFQKLYLPSSVIGGIIGLIVLHTGNDLIAPSWIEGWGKLPGFLINIVFASLFIGAALPGLNNIWKKASAQLAYGQIVAWGQYVVAILLVILFLKPLFGVHELFGVIVPVGFEGGHGTAGGLKETFESFGWSEGFDFGMGSATVGMVSAIVVGMGLINWAAQRKLTTHLKPVSYLSEYELQGIYSEENRPFAGKQTVSSESIDSLAFHVAIVGVAICIGYLLKLGLTGLEGFIPASRNMKIIESFPLFPLSLIGGIIVQLLFSKFDKNSLIDRGLILHIGGTAMDFLVVAAISIIRLDVVAKGLIPFMIIVTGGVLWNVFCVTVLARKLLPNHWFERAIAEMGQSMGVTATGLLLLRVVDPKNKTDAAQAFGYKQLLHEPFMGGGLWTSAAIPLIVHKGGIFVLTISVTAIIVWLIVWRTFIYKKG